MFLLVSDVVYVGMLFVPFRTQVLTAFDHFSKQYEMSHMRMTMDGRGPSFFFSFFFLRPLPHFGNSEK